MNPRRLAHVLLTTCAVAVAAAVHADEASHRQEVQNLFRLTHMETKIEESVQTVLDIQLRQNPELAAHAGAVRAFLVRHMGWDALKDELEAMYLASFTEEELREMNAFYITPVGQKVLTRVPELVQERNQLAATRLQQNLAELQQELAAAESPR